MGLKTGICIKETKEVVFENTAVPVGGEIPVFGTPFMLGFAEASACNLIRPYLEKGYTTVGTDASLEHTAPTPIGFKVDVITTLTEINGKKLRFDSIFSCDGKRIGHVEHGRYIVNKEKFINNMEKK